MSSSFTRAALAGAAALALAQAGAFAQAGVGDTVLVVREGSSARQLVGLELAPVHAAVVGVVDEISLDDTRGEGA